MTWHRDDSHVRERDQRGAKSATAAAAHPRAVNKADEAQPQHNRDHEGYLIKELQQLLRTQIEARLRAKGLWLSFPHATVLMLLREEPGLSGAQLARRNSVTAQTMNGLLLPLEAKGLIERRADPENARVLKCYLKPKGSGILQQGMHEAGTVFNLMLGHLSDGEREQFRGILRRCIDALHSRGLQASHSEGSVAASGLTKTPSTRIRQGLKPKTKRLNGSVR